MEKQINRTDWVLDIVINKLLLIDSDTMFGCAKKAIHGKLPSELKNLIYYSDRVFDDFSNLSLGYELYNYGRFCKEYERGRSELSFCKAHGADQDLVAPMSHSLGLEIDSGYDVKENIDITDFQTIVPIADGGSGYLIVLFRHSSIDLTLTIKTQDNYLYMLAPSFTTHLRELKNGLVNGTYYVRDNEVIYPLLWTQKLQANSEEGLPAESCLT